MKRAENIEADIKNICQPEYESDLVCKILKDYEGIQVLDGIVKSNDLEKYVEGKLVDFRCRRDIIYDGEHCSIINVRPRDYGILVYFEKRYDKDGILTIIYKVDRKRILWMINSKNYYFMQKSFEFLPNLDELYNLHLLKKYNKTLFRWFMRRLISDLEYVRALNKIN